MSRGRWLTLAVAGAAAALVLVGAFVLPRLVDDEPDVYAGTAPTGDPDTTTLADVVETDYKGGHTPDDVQYAETPPMGGVHSDPWLQCGVYDEPVREEYAVHSLEHGTVWITYDPDLDEDDVDTLADALPDKGILSPHDDLPSPVVVTVWNRQLSLTGPEDAGLTAFLDEFGDGGTSPESFSSCEGGAVDFED